MKFPITAVRSSSALQSLPPGNVCSISVINSLFDDVVVPCNCFKKGSSNFVRFHMVPSSDLCDHHWRVLWTLGSSKLAKYAVLPLTYILCSGNGVCVCVYVQSVMCLNPFVRLPSTLTSPVLSSSSNLSYNEWSALLV